MRRVPAPVIDAGLAVALAVAVTIGIRVAPGPGARPDALAYGFGLTIAGLALARRRWPLVVLLASVATPQVYYLSDYTSIYPAMPGSTPWRRSLQRWGSGVRLFTATSPAPAAEHSPRTRSRRPGRPLVPPLASRHGRTWPFRVPGCGLVVTQAS